MVVQLMDSVSVTYAEPSIFSNIVANVLPLIYIGFGVYVVYVIAKKLLNNFREKHKRDE